MTRRSPARSLRRARRPARSAAEPNRPGLALPVVILVDRQGRRRSARETGPGGRGAARDAAGRGGRAGSRRPGEARRRAGAEPGESRRRHRRRARGDWPVLSCPDRIAASISSLVIDFSGRWVLGAGPVGGAAAGRRRDDRAVGAATGGRAGTSAHTTGRFTAAAVARGFAAGPSRRAGGRRRRTDPWRHGTDSGRRHVVARLERLEARCAAPRRRRRLGRRLTTSGVLRGPVDCGSTRGRGDVPR